MKKNVILFLVFIFSMDFLGEEIMPVKRTMGGWPNTLHNTPFAVQQASLGQRSFSVSLAPADVYAVVGEFNIDHTSFAYSTNDGIILGETNSHQYVSVIWKISAPCGNKFKSGKIIAKGKFLERAEDKVPVKVPEDVLDLSIGSDLKLVGGGGFWASFKGVTLGDSQSALFKKQADPTYLAEITIPEGLQVIYLAATRKVTPEDAGPRQFLLQNLEVEYDLDPGKGLEISYVNPEPVWAENEAITLEIKATGYTNLDRVWWRLQDMNGTIFGEGAVGLTAGKTEIDFSGTGSGFYRLLVYDSPEAEMPANTQDLAILEAQDEIRRKKSIFGALGYPNRAGIHGSMGEPDVADMRILKLMGVRWVKESALWAWSQEGPDKPVILKNIDLLKKIKKEGFDLIVTCGTAPKWASGNKSGAAPPLPEHFDSWQNFNKYVAESTKGSVTWFQSWNEPNNPNTFWQPKPWDLEKRATLAKKIQEVQYKGLKAGNPEAKLIGGCFAGVPANWYEMWLSDPHNTLKFQDGMSGHPYNQVSRETNWAHAFPAEPNLIPRIMAARKVMDEKGAAEQPMFFTEYGWYTPKTSPEDQARWTARQNIIIKAYQEKTKTEALCLFSPGDIKNGHNIFRFNPDIQPGQHRLLPVIGAYAVSTSLLADAKPLAAISDFPNPVRCYSFKQGNKTVYAAWVTEEKESGEVIFPIKKDRQALQVGMMGEKKIVSLTPGIGMKLPQNHDPVYWVVSDENAPFVLPGRLQFSVSDTSGLSNMELQVGNLGPESMNTEISVDQPWLKVDLKNDKLVVNIVKDQLAPGEYKGQIKIKAGNKTITVPVHVSRFKDGKCVPAPGRKAADEKNSTESAKLKYVRSKTVKKVVNFTMISRLCAGVVVGTAMLANSAEAQESDGLQNLARGKMVKYSLVDKEGKTLDGAKYKDPDFVNLKDGKRTDTSIAKSDWGANKAKEMRVRFDFGQEVSPKRMNIIWLLWKSKGHWIDRVKVLFGNDPANLQEVAAVKVAWAPERSIPIQVDLPAGKGRYLDLVIDQDAHPEHMMFTIAEIEIFGSAKDRAKLDK